MKIMGLQKVTVIDYPGKIACTVFLHGCNFKCGYCYNSCKEHDDSFSEERFFKFLNKRKNELDAVVICGGEPCIHEDIVEFIGKIKDLGFLVKLDTNGSFPVILEELIDDKLIDYVAMDIKYPLRKYKKRKKQIKDSVSIIMESDIDYHFRTTVVPGLINKEDLVDIARTIKGAKGYVLQQFKNENCLDEDFEKIDPYTDDYIEEMQEEVNKLIENGNKKIPKDM